MTEGIVTRVLRPLMSGKEAQVYLVESGGELRVAKIYKEATNRSFKHRAEYTEGRSVRSSRDARAMQKKSKYGRAMEEDAWRSAEVDIIYRLTAAGVRVPRPFHFVDGVLIMELVKDADGDPAPRLGDVDVGPKAARDIFDHLLREVVRMVCSGVVHGDLSDFNVLLGADGPVIIDFPQSVDPSKNQNARDLLVRDLDNLTTFLSRHEPKMRHRPYGQEIWAAYERSELTPDTVLLGNWRPKESAVDTSALLDELAEVEEEALVRRLRGRPPVSKAADPRSARATGLGQGPSTTHGRSETHPKSHQPGREHEHGRHSGTTGQRRKQGDVPGRAREVRPALGAEAVRQRPGSAPVERRTFERSAREVRGQRQPLVAQGRGQKPLEVERAPREKVSAEAQRSSGPRRKRRQRRRRS